MTRQCKQTDWWAKGRLRVRGGSRRADEDVQSRISLLTDLIPIIDIHQLTAPFNSQLMTTYAAPLVPSGSMPAGGPALAAAGEHIGQCV